MIIPESNYYPPSYVPNDLVRAPIPFWGIDAFACPDKILISNKMYYPLLRLYQKSLYDKISLYGISAYRSYKRQEEIYLDSISQKGYLHTSMFIVKPGYSQHQSGLAIDISSPCVDYDLIEEFRYTPEGIWLSQNAPKFGFTLPYDHEPWHIYFNI